MHCDLQVLNYTFLGIKMANFKTVGSYKRGKEGGQQSYVECNRAHGNRKGMNTKLQKLPVTHPVVNRTSFF